MASVFGIDLIKSTTGLFKSARTRKKSSPWGGGPAGGAQGRSSQSGYAGLADYERNDDVGRLVEDEIIPRLLMVHQDDPRMSLFPSDQTLTDPANASAVENDFRVTSGTQSNDNAIGLEGRQYKASPFVKGAGPVFDDTAIDLFTAEVLANEADTLADMVGKYLDQGLAPEALFIELIAPTARRLGDKWTDDECDFVDVTMGLWRLQQVLRTIALWAPPAPGWHPRGSKALFTSMPGDQHSLGTLIISECFQRGGWEVETLIEPQQSDIFQAISTTSFDVIGLTVTTDFYIGEVPKLLTAMRSVSCNPNMAIMIGGPALGYDPRRARDLGADGTAPDASAALKLADELVSAGVKRSALSF